MPHGVIEDLGMESFVGMYADGYYVYSKHNLAVVAERPYVYDSDSDYPLSDYSVDTTFDLDSDDRACYR
eukprot:gene18452-22017_t